MPVSWRLHVLEERLNREFGGACRVESVELQELDHAEASTALHALVSSQGGFPVVLVDGVAVCVDDIETDAIIKQAATNTASSGGMSR